MNVVKNGTCISKLENGTVFRVQRGICQNCRYSFFARSPNYGYGKHYPDDLKEKSTMQDASFNEAERGEYGKQGEMMQRHADPGMAHLQQRIVRNISTTRL